MEWDVAVFTCDQNRASTIKPVYIQIFGDAGYSDIMTLPRALQRGAKDNFQFATGEIGFPYILRVFMTSSTDDWKLNKVRCVVFL